MFDQLVNHTNPSVRFWALTTLAGMPLTASEVVAVREKISTIPAVRAILDAQYPQGYWMHPGLGISPRYRATVWQVLFLAQFGVGRMDPVDRALDVLLAQNLDKQDSLPGMGGFRVQRDADPSLALTGALLWALGRMGYTEDTRLVSVWAWARETCARRRGTLGLKAAAWMLRAAVVWQEYVPNAAKGFRRNDVTPSAAKGFQRNDVTPSAAKGFQRNDVILSAVEGSDVMTWCADALSRALLGPEERSLPADLYFPVADCFGRLMACEALVEAGRGACVPAQYWEWLTDKRGVDGFWPLECVPGRLWWDPGKKGVPNPWITVRALKVLEGV